eukprot:Stramenopile-MAST_4_protein_5337
MENVLETGQRVLAALTAWDELCPGVVVEVDIDAYLTEKTVPFSYTVQFDSGIWCTVEPGNICSEQLAKAFDPVVQTCLKTNTAMQEKVMEKNHGHDSSEETQQMPVKTDHAHASTEVTDPLPVTIDHAHDSADEIQQLPEKTVHAHDSSEEIRQLSQEQEQLEKALDQQSNDDHEY